MKTNLAQTCLLALVLAPPAAVQAQFNYTTNNGAITITGYTGPGGAVTIPPTINGLPVTIIGSSAFAYINSLTSVTIPDSVTSIGVQAFYSCYYSLTNVTIGNSVTNIGGDAFWNCAHLISVAIPDSVISIGDFAFYYCANLTNVTIPTNVTSIGYSAFWGCASLTNVRIGNGVPSVEDYTFQGCVSLTNVTIGSGVTNIGILAFGGCGLTSVTIPNGVTSIGDGAFADCANLTNVTIGNGVTSIGDGVFVYCANLTSAYFKGNAPTFGWYVFVDEWNLSADPVTVYYLPGTTGWDSVYLFVPVTLWLPQVLTGDGNIGVRTNQFGFNIAWASGQTVVVEAANDLSNPVWSPVATNILTSDSSHFSDPQSSNYSARFYRLRSP